MIWKQDLLINHPSRRFSAMQLHQQKFKESGLIVNPKLILKRKRSRSRKSIPNKFFHCGVFIFSDVFTDVSPQFSPQFLPHFFHSFFHIDWKRFQKLVHCIDLLKGSRTKKHFKISGNLRSGGIYNFFWIIIVLYFFFHSDQERNGLHCNPFRAQKLNKHYNKIDSYMTILYYFTKIWQAVIKNQCKKPHKEG